MKIAYLTHQFFPRHIGGVEVYTYGLARRAIEQGDEVCVITYHESPSPDLADFGRQRTQYNEIPIIEIHYNLSVAPQPARFEYCNRYTADHLREELTRFQPDLVHVMHAMKLSASALEICYELHLPVIVTLADYWFICPRHILLKWNGELCSGPKHPLYCVKCLYHTHRFAPSPLYQRANWVVWLRLAIGRVWHRQQHEHFWAEIRAMAQRNRYLRQVLGRADRVIALSHFQKAMFVKNGYPKRGIRVIEHGLEIDGLIAAAPPDSEIPIVVFIGSLVPHKGLHILLEALAACPDVPLELRIYGDTRQPTAYLQRVLALSSGDQRVRWMGTFPPEDQGRILQEVSVLAMPALWYENDPLVVKAALYLGIPVLASRIGTLMELVKSPDRGWLITPGDIAAWADGLRRLPTHDFSQRRPHPIKSMDEHATEIFDVYNEVIEHYDTTASA